MTDRINELIEKSYVEIPHERDWDATTAVFDKRKFAELIINDCAILANYYYSRNECIRGINIKDHFGVK